MFNKDTSVAIVLNQRFEWENIVSKYNFPDKNLYQGTIDSLSWFLKNGHKSNSLRDGFKEARQIASDIIEFHKLI